MRGLLDGVVFHGSFGSGLHSILNVGLFLASLEQRRNSARIMGFLVAIECVSTHPHHLAGFGHIAQFFRQFQQPELFFSLKDVIVGLLL